MYAHNTICSPGVLSLRTALTALFIATVFPIALYAQTTGPFRQIETEHFRFIYRQGDEQAVAMLYSFAEEIYGDISTYFDDYPDDIDVFVNSQVELTNGYFDPNRSALTLYTTPPSTPYFGTSHEQWLRTLFTHELTHYIHLTDRDGLFGLLSYITGLPMAAATGSFLPGWMLEGIGTVFESMYSPGGRATSQYFEMRAKALIMESQLPSHKQAWYSGNSVPSDRVYLTGYMMISYLMQQYGEDIFVRIQNRFTSFPFLGPGPAFRHITGTSIRQAWSDMQNHYRVKFATDLQLPRGEKLFESETGEFYLPISSDAGWILYRELHDRPGQLVLYNPDDGSEQVLTTPGLTDPSSFTATADGQTVYFSTYQSSRSFSQGRQVTSDIYRMETLTGSVEQVTGETSLIHPAVSPDGNRLVAVELRGLYSRLVEIDPGSGELTVLYEEKQTHIQNPVFSPDGQKIALSIHRRGIQDIEIFDLSSASLESIYGNDAAGDFYPRFDGNNAVVFSSDRNGRLELFRADLSNGQLSQLLADRVGAYAGFIEQGTVYYASYSAAGFSVHSQELSAQVPGNPVEIIHVAVPPVVELPDLPESRAYLNLAVPRLFIPDIALGLIPLEITGYSAQLYGTNVTGSNQWTASGSLYPQDTQYALQFEITQSINLADISLALSHEYFTRLRNNNLTPDPDDYLKEFIQYSSLTTNMAIPLVNGAVLSKATWSGPFAGFQADSTIVSSEPMTSGPQLGGNMRYLGQLGYNHAVQYGAPAAALFGGNAWNVSASWLFPLAVPGNSIDLHRVSASSGVFLSTTANQIAGMELDGTWFSDSAYASYYSTVGDISRSAREYLSSHNLQSRLRLSYKVPLYVTDTHLWYHTRLTGLSTRFFTEWFYMAQTPLTGPIDLYPDLYLSADFNIHFESNSGPSKIGIGYTIPLPRDDQNQSYIYFNFRLPGLSATNQLTDALYP